MSFLSYFLLITLCTSSALSHTLKKAFSEQTLQIIHFNDFHARFEQTSPSSTACVDESKCIGGFPRLYTKMMEMKEKYPSGVFLDAGDSFQGTLWYNILKWNVTQYFINSLPLDAHTLGNHEFDDGVAGAIPYIKALKTPMLVANIDASLEPEFQNLCKPSIVIERNGRKIGIIGVMISTAPEIASTGKLIFKDEIETVRAEAKDLTKQGVDIIIVLSHSGYFKDLEIAKEAGENIDVIVGAHTHTLLYNGIPPNNDIAQDVYPTVVNSTAGNKVLVVQALAFTKYLGNLTVKFDEDGKVTGYEGQPIFLENSIKQDEEMLRRLQPFKEIVDAQGKRVVGNTKVDLTKNDCMFGDCNLGNFITDSFIDYLVDESPEGSWTYAAVAILAQGGIRASILSGNITYSDVVIAQPFENTLTTLDIKGVHLLETFEYSVSDENLFYMLQVSGLQLSFDMDKPVGKRVVSASIRCDKCVIPTYSPIDPEKIYSIATVNFLADGGDGFTAISNNKMNQKVWARDVDVILRYMDKMSPIYHEKGNRIKVSNINKKFADYM